MNAEMLTVEQMEAERDEIEVALARIRSQIESAAAKVREGGEYASADWFARAKAALRFKGQRHQMLLRSIATIRKTQRVATSAFGQAFIDAAKRRLDPGLVQELLDEAREVVQQGKAPATDAEALRRDDEDRG